MKNIFSEQSSPVCEWMEKYVCTQENEIFISVLYTPLRFYYHYYYYIQSVEKLAL